MGWAPRAFLYVRPVRRSAVRRGRSGFLDHSRRDCVVVGKADAHAPRLARVDIVLQLPEPVVPGLQLGVVGQARTELEVRHNVVGSRINQILLLVLGSEVKNVLEPAAVHESHIIGERWIKVWVAGRQG